MHEPDVLALSRPHTVIVTCFNRSWTLRYNTATSWIGACGWDLETLAGVFPGGIADDDVTDMWAHVSDDDASRRWTNTARAALGRASGRDWWWALNLIRRCLESWSYINGALLLKGVDSNSMTLPSWLDAAYMLLWQGCDEEGRMKLDLDLSLPPAGVGVKQSAQAKRKMLEAFAAD